MTDTSTGTISRKFFMSETEVTNALMAEVMQWAYNENKFTETNSSVSVTSVDYRSQQLLDLDDSYIKINYDGSGSFSVDSGFENHPIMSVTWYGAIMFCNWLTEMRDDNTDDVVYNGISDSWTADDTISDDSRTGYRLPSSEEWEYAARYIGTTEPGAGNLVSEYIAQSYNGGDASLTTGYYWAPGDYASGAISDYTNETETRDVAWYGGMAGGNELKPVAGKNENQLGLFDMSGNVWEWCFTEISSYRVWGGSWLSTASGQQVGYWATFTSDSEYAYIGFRFSRTQ